MQDRVAKQRKRHFHIGVSGHLLERGQALQPRHGDQTLEQPSQLMNLRNRGLEIEDRLVRLDSGAEGVEHQPPCPFVDPGDVLHRVARRQHVQVGDDEIGVVGRLKTRPVAERPNEVAEMQWTGGPVTRQHPGSGGRDSL